MCSCQVNPDSLMLSARASQSIKYAGFLTEEIVEGVAWHCNQGIQEGIGAGKPTLGGGEIPPPVRILLYSSIHC